MVANACDLVVGVARAGVDVVPSETHPLEEAYPWEVVVLDECGNQSQVSWMDGAGPCGVQVGVACFPSSLGMAFPSLMGDEREAGLWVGSDGETGQETCLACWSGTEEVGDTFLMDVGVAGVPLGADPSLDQEVRPHSHPKMVGVVQRVEDDAWDLENDWNDGERVAGGLGKDHSKIGWDPLLGDASSRGHTTLESGCGGENPSHLGSEALGSPERMSPCFPVGPGDHKLLMMRGRGVACDPCVNQALD